MAMSCPNYNLYLNILYKYDLLNNMCLFYAKTYLKIYVKIATNNNFESLINESKYDQVKINYCIQNLTYISLFLY